MKAYLDEYVVGQEQLKKVLSMSVYHYLTGKGNQPFMMIGDSGTGKNHIINTLKRYKEIRDRMPVVNYDMSKITPNGFEGDSIKDIIKLFKQTAKAKSMSGEEGIIYLDEIDKIVMPNMDKAGENVNRLVQCQLLSMLSGTIIEDIDTSKILFILGGAFADLKELKKKRENYSTLGFCTKENSSIEQNTLRDDLCKIGMQRELLGRISAIVEMEQLDRSQLKEILTHGKIGPIAKKQREYEVDELKLVVEENVIDLIVDRIVQENLGARSAVNIVEDIIGSYNFDMLEQNYHVMKIHERMLTHAEPPIFERYMTNEE